MASYATQLPDVTYPDAISPNPNAVSGARSNQTSPSRYPSPWGSGAGEWAEAYKKATKVVEQLTLEEKVNLTTGMIPMCDDVGTQLTECTRIWLAARTMRRSNWRCSSPWYPWAMPPRLACWCKIYGVSA